MKELVTGIKKPSQAFQKDFVNIEDEAETLAKKGDFEDEGGQVFEGKRMR